MGRSLEIPGLMMITSFAFQQLKNCIQLCARYKAVYEHSTTVYVVEWEVFIPAMRGVICSALTMFALVLLIQIPLFML